MKLSLPYNMRWYLTKLKRLYVGNLKKQRCRHTQYTAVQWSTNPVSVNVFVAAYSMLLLSILESVIFSGQSASDGLAAADTL